MAVEGTNNSASATKTRKKLSSTGAKTNRPRSGAMSGGSRGMSNTIASPEPPTPISKKP